MYTETARKEELEQITEPGLGILILPYIGTFLMSLIAIRHNDVKKLHGASISLQWHKRLQNFLIRKCVKFFRSFKLGVAMLYVSLAYCSIEYTHFFFESARNGGQLDHDYFCFYLCTGLWNGIFGIFQQSA